MEATTPKQAPLDGPWTDMLNLSDEARAFSGTAVYTKDFDMRPLSKVSHLELDLGWVAVTEKVSPNGQPITTHISQFYRLDLEKFVRPGPNRLSVEVTNTCYNRLAYDAGQPENTRKT